jgi:hypothetical protein
VHNGATTVNAFGLLANFVGGNLDELGDENNVGVWYGKDSVYEVLAPAFNDTGLAAAYGSATAGQPVYLFAGIDGRLGVEAQSGGGNVQEPTAVGTGDAVAELIERSSASKIKIKLLV